MPDRARRLTFWVGLTLIVLLGALLRLWQASESLWLDELHTSWVVSGPFNEIANRARQGNQSPVYFYLVCASTSVLGQNELATRLPSLVAGIGLIMAVGAVTWRWCGAMTAGWLAAALVAVDHNMTFFAQEARPYAVVQLVAVGQLAAFWRLQTKPGWPTRLAVTGGWILLFHLHYTAVLLLVGQLLWWVGIQFWQRGQGAYRPRQLLSDLLLAAVACALTWTHLSEIASRRGMWAMFIQQQPPWVAWRWFHWDLYVLSALLVCGAVAVGGRLLSRLPRQPARNRPSPSWPNWVATVPLLLSWWAAPVLLAWLLTATNLARVFLLRYLIGVAVAPMVCAGLCLAACRGPRARGVACLAVLATAVWGNGLGTQFLRDGRLITDRRQDWRNAVGWLNTNRLDEAPILVRSGLIEADQLRGTSSEALRAYCLFPVQGLYRLADADVVIPLPTSYPGRISPETVRLVHDHRGGWLLLNARPASRSAIREDLRASLADHNLTLVREASFGNVVVWEVRSEFR